MPYQKRSPVKRKCAHCGTKFESTHKSRIYCCQSCNTLAWRARQDRFDAKAPVAAAPAGSLDLTIQNVGVVALGALLAQGGTYLAQQLTQGGSETERLRADIQQLQQHVGLAPATLLVAPGAPFLPAPLREATGPVVQIKVENQLFPFVRLEYHGHALFHYPAEGVVLCEVRPGEYQRVESDAHMAQLAAHPRVQAVPASLPPGQDPFGPEWLAGFQQLAAQQAAKEAAWEEMWQASDPFGIGRTSPPLADSTSISADASGPDPTPALPRTHS